VQRFNVTNCSSMLHSGNNTVTLNFIEGITNASVSGGLLGIKYITNDFGTVSTSGQERIYLPDIDGVINLYDGFMVPGTLQSMNVYLHYWVANNVTLPIFFDIGNTQVYQSNSTGEITPPIISDGFLSGRLNNYANMSNTTVPIRLGFYSGNMTNSTGNITDVFILTSRAGPMNDTDIWNGTVFEQRMKVAQRLDNLSVDIILNTSGNRVGLGSYYASGSTDQSLTNNTANLKNIINNYKVQNPKEAERGICKPLEEAANELDNYPARKHVIMMMTDGNFTKNNCEAADIKKLICEDYAPLRNIIFYNIGFGPETINNPVIFDLLNSTANCSGGQFAIAENYSALENIYRNFATQISQSSIVYTFQRATSVRDAASHLYNDSYIEISYEPSFSAAQQNQIPITFQTPQFNNCTPTINIPEGVTVTEAHIVSYSGDYWTKRLSVNGTVVYNLSIYGVNYTNLGDPFQLLVPPYLLTTGDHLFSIALGANSSIDFPCSMSDSLIYTGLVSAATNRTPVLPNPLSSSGCFWHVESESGGFQDLKVPLDYSGSSKCNYTNANISYNDKDAYDVAAFNLLMQLDPDKDGRVSVNFQEEDLEISVTLVTDVPYLWGPTLVKVNAWQ